MKTTIALIDPYTSASYLANTMRDAGIITVAVFTKTPEKTGDYFKISSDLFDKQIFLDEPSANDIIETLGCYSINYIINGNEFSTNMTDQVTQELLPSLSNDPNTSHLRCDKFYMQETLKTHGLSNIRQEKLNIMDIKHSLANGTIKFPCFCKPIKGQGTIGAFKATNQQELLSGLQNVLSTGAADKSSDYLIQEYVDGQEFFIDAFSFKGSHYISSVQKYQRQLTNGIPVLRYSEPVYNKALWDRCANFVKQALTVTELQNGFSHTEVFITPEDETKLIEINPRISGGKGYCNKLTKTLGLHSQVDLLLGNLNGNIQESSIENKNGFARRLYLFNWTNNPLKDPSPYLENISSIHSYELLSPIGHVNASNNKYVSNIDLFVLMHNQDRNALESDSLKLFELEKSGLLL